MGLERGVAVVKVEEEMMEDGCERDSTKEFMRGSGIQRSFSNKASSLNQFMSFKTVQDVIAKNTTDPGGVYQKSLVPSEQGSATYAMATYLSLNFNGISLHQRNEVKEAANSVNRPTMNNPFFKTHVTPISHHTVASDGVAAVSHSIVPLAGSALPSCIPKSASSSPAQLTIFYAGNVNVYDDVSPEKAHAIMFLAGDGSPANANIVHRAEAAAPPLKQLQQGGVNKPVSASSIAPTMQMDSQVVPSLGSTAAVPLIPSAVPQARRASLARFLEKRKERVMSRAPYDTNRKSPENASTPEPSMGDSVVCSLSGSKDDS